MNTNTATIRATSASVIGARHQHAGRNGQDAAATFVGEGIAVAVVCDGCSSGASSEVGARLGARWFAERLGQALVAGASVEDRATWEAARRDVATRMRMLVAVNELATTRQARSVFCARAACMAARVDALAGAGADPAGARAAGACTASGDVASADVASADVARAAAIDADASDVDGIDADAVHDLLLFTVVAAAITAEGAAVWALGDGAYGYDGVVRVLGPFADNAPPYLAYDLLGDPRDAHFEVLPSARRVVIATDGAQDLDYDLAAFGAISLINPDSLRRRLVILARGEERIAWGEGRVHRTPAVLQDDCAVAILERLA